MGVSNRSMKGDIVLLDFPFSEAALTVNNTTTTGTGLAANTKRRPALVICDCAFGDKLLAQITTKNKQTSDCVNLEPADLTSGLLRNSSYIRTTKLFFCEEVKIERTIGALSKIKHQEVLDNLFENLKI